MEIVIARYNENLSWILEILERTSEFNNLKITVYNKGNTPAVINSYNESNEKFLKRLELQRSRVTFIQLPNVGVCDHTYLHHIVSRYDSLAPSTLFLPGSAYDDETKRPRLLVLMQSLIVAMKSKSNEVPEVTAVISIPDAFKSNYVSFSRRKQVDTYECSDSRNRDGNQSITHSTLRPFGKWYDVHLHPLLGPARNITLKGMFMVGKAKLLNRPLSMYTKLLDMVSHHRFPEEAHYIERSWHAIIDPKPQEEISLLLVVPYIKEIIGFILILIAVGVVIVLSKMKKPIIKFASSSASSSASSASSSVSSSASSSVNANPVALPLPSLLP